MIGYQPDGPIRNCQNQSVVMNSDSNKTSVTNVSNLTKNSTEIWQNSSAEVLNQCIENCIESGNKKADSKFSAGENVKTLSTADKTVSSNNVPRNNAGSIHCSSSHNVPSGHAMT